MPTVHRIRRPWEVSRQKVEASPVSEEKRLAETRFYRTKVWARARRLQLQKEPLCRHCYQKGKMTEATMVDHINPIKDGGERLDENNFQSLCDSCHAKKRTAEGRYYQSKKKE